MILVVGRRFSSTTSSTCYLTTVAVMSIVVLRWTQGADV